ncbi:MAG: Nif3-like dinuclear metal center hexameric protein [Clostridia bacterium]
MMNVNELVGILDVIAPLSMAEEWDNVGLLLGHGEAEVETILICLDVTHHALERAVEEGAGLILSHHPLIYDPLKTITDPLLLRIIEEKVAVIALHTNYDAVRMNGLLADSLGIINGRGVLSSGNEKGFLGIQGDFSREMSGDMLLAKVKDVFGVSNLRISGKERPVYRTAAVAGGGLGSMTPYIGDLDADVFITGEVKYNHAVVLSGRGPLVVEAGHYQTERIFIRDMASLLRENTSLKGIIEHEEELTRYL